MGAISDWLERRGLYIALLAAWIAMLGSLYLSEVAGYIPCTLCWYQRILMYPLTGILAIGLLRRDVGVYAYVLPFSVLGIVVSTYHYLLQKTDLFSDAVTCKVGIPCSSIWINWFGFVTIPFLAMTAFIIISVVTIIVWQSVSVDEDEDKDKVEGLTPWLPVGGVIGSVIMVFALMALVGGSDDGNETTAPSVITTQPTVDGALLYQQACAACHGGQLEGVEGLGNTLVPSTFVDERSDEELLAFIREGRWLDDPDNTTGLVMPESGGRPDLTDNEMQAVVTHIRTQNAPAE